MKFLQEWLSVLIEWTGNLIGLPFRIIFEIGLLCGYALEKIDSFFNEWAFRVCYWKRNI